MAEHMEVSGAPAPMPLKAVARANAVAAPQGARAAPSARARVGRAVAGERWIARLLRGGALLSGGLFLVSLGLEALPQCARVQQATEVLRGAGASLLLVTPVARLVVAGALLGLRGEWRYTLCAAGVLGLLALAVGAGLHA